MAKQTVPIAEELVEVVGVDVMNMFQGMCEEYVAARDAEREYSAIKKSVGDGIKNVIESYPQLSAVKFNKFTVKQSNTERKTINEEMLKVTLLSKGMSIADIQEVIAMSSKVSISTTLTITVPKNKE